MSDSDQRLTELEIRLSHSERTVEQLHEVVLLLKGDLERLGRKFEELQEQMESSSQETGPADDRPPHW
ncbi:MAG: SlyX family protein [Fibrobacterota bacterium]|nr:SlyX family protein [Fibrobacterota bacterium]QQS06141.1 MAG: SlyX family protein [Fibrobacterota bacterium]